MREPPLPHAAAALRHGEKHAGLPAEQRAGVAAAAMKKKAHRPPP